MIKHKDCLGREIRTGDRIGVAFSYSRSSVGYIRVGTVETLIPRFTMRWEDDKNVTGPVSPPMAYAPSRVVRL